MSHPRQGNLSVFLVGTEFFRSYGGIQYVNRLLVRAFCAMGCRTPLNLEVFSFADGPEHFPLMDCSGAGVRWHGASRGRGDMAWRLTKRLAVTGPDLVLFTHVSLLPLEEAVRRFAPGARVALLAHGTEVWQPLGVRTARLLSRVHSFVSPSAYTAEKLTEVHAIAQEKITVIPHGLDPEWTAVHGGGNIAQDEPPAARTGRLLLSVTRLTPADREGKGIEVVLRALPAVLTQCPGSRYRVVGGGADLPQLAALVQKLGLDPVTDLTGALRNETLRRAYAAADVFVLPTQVEGFGIVFLEAMYSGLPVLAVRAAAAPEVVQDGVTGILVPPGDSKELAAALVTLLSDDGRRRAMGEAGRRRAEQMYRFEHFTARWELWLAAQAPEALYAARQTDVHTQARAVAGAL